MKLVQPLLGAYLATLFVRVDQGRNTNGATARNKLALQKCQRSAEPAMVDALKTDSKGSDTRLESNGQCDFAYSIEGLAGMEFANPSDFIQGSYFADELRVDGAMAPAGKLSRLTLCGPHFQNAGRELQCPQM
jgi:hypothetical protein